FGLVIAVRRAPSRSLLLLFDPRGEESGEAAEFVLAQASDRALELLLALVEQRFELLADPGGEAFALLTRQRIADRIQSLARAHLGQLVGPAPFGQLAIRIQQHHPWLLRRQSAAQRHHRVERDAALVPHR